MKKQKELTLTDKFRENPWILSTLILGIMVLVLLVGSINEEKEQSMVDNLISNKVMFVYSSHCSACHKQIEIFGNDWNKYMDSGLTLDCLNNQNELCQQIRVTPSWVINNGTDYIVIGEGVIQ